MKFSMKAIGLTVSMCALLLFSLRYTEGRVDKGRFAVMNPAATQLPYEEINAYYDGSRWVSGGTQCDGSREVTILKPIGKSNRIRVTAFPKSRPGERTELTLRQKGEPDCGMMKCYYTYVGSGPSQRYLVMESNYRDDELYWVHTVMVSKGKAAEDSSDQCRWMERTRIALITDQRTIYVTQNEAGGLEYRSFNYNGAGTEPSIIVKDGKSHLDTTRGIESFTFSNEGYTYEINVSTSDKRPFAEVLIRHNGETVQKERSLAYAYAKKT